MKLIFSDNVPSNFFKALSYHVESPPSFLSKILNRPESSSLLLQLLNKDILKPGQIKEIQNYLIEIYLTDSNHPTDTVDRFDAFEFLFTSSPKLLYQRLSELMSNFTYLDWSIDGDKFTFKKDNPVGIKNLGTLCFLNSILQQLFGIYEVRQSLYSYSDEDEFLLALKKIFAQLQFTNLSALETDQLAQHWTNWD